MDLSGIVKKMKVRTKLICASAIMIPFMLCIGYAGYNGIQNVMNNLREIFSVRLPSIDYLLQADRDLQQLLVAERSLIFANSKSETFKDLLTEIFDFIETNVDDL